MKTFPAVIGHLAFALLVVSQHAIAQTIDISGRWTGKTVCPLGPVSFAIDVKDRTGTFSYSSDYGPGRSDSASFPVEITTKTGWEGEWVKFSKPGQSARNYQSFGTISGLLSNYGRTLSVRGYDIGDCREFKLTRVTASHGQPPASAAANPGNREPNKDQMRAAILYALQAPVSITMFKKISCTPGTRRPGYLCQYTASASYHSGSKPIDDLFKAIFGSSNLPEETGSAHFVYDGSRSRWVIVPK